LTTSWLINSLSTSELVWPTRANPPPDPALPPLAQVLRHQRLQAQALPRPLLLW
jgi:hypothetical protein